MAYQVLARKYRPQYFRDVAGQEHVTRTLLNALQQDRIAHGYIFSGHRGIGKTTIARILAMALNCQRAIGSVERPTPEPCGTCDSCTEIRAGNAVDVIEIDAATNRGIDEIRELRDAARYRPARDRYKVYILDEAHQITDAAFNALLKTLEEPPEHVIFMMATTQPEDIPQTIRSRSQHFSFHAVKFDDILAELRGIAEKEGIASGDDALALLAEAGDGSMRDALSIMDQAIASAPLVDGRPHVDAAEIRELMGSVPNSVFERLLEAVSENASAAVMEEANRLLNAGNSPSQLARQFVRYLRNCLMAKVGGEQTELLQVSADERARAARTAMLFSEEDLLRFLQVMLRTFDDLNYRQEQRFHLELGLLKLVHMQRLIPLEQVLSQLPGTAARGVLPTVPSSPAASTPRADAGAARGRIAAPPSVPPPVRSGSAPAPAQKTDSPARPAFSPFEADSRRKAAGDSVNARQPAVIPETIQDTSTVTNLAVEERQAEPAHAGNGAHPPRLATPFPAVESQSETASKAPQGVVGLAEPDPIAVAIRHEPPNPEIAGRTTPEQDWRTAAAEEELAEDEPAGAPPVDLDSLRDAIATSLDDKGHNTAAALLSAGRWSIDGDTVVVEVGVKKTMLGLMMNPEAERITKKAMADAGVTMKFRVMPGEAGMAPGGATRPAPTGSIQSLALENPLVKQAQELFGAEVRSVLDLRDKK